MTIRVRIHPTFSMIQRCYLPRSLRDHLGQPFWCWLRWQLQPIQSHCNNFCEENNSLSAKHQTKQNIARFHGALHHELNWNQLKISREIIAGWRAKLTRENEALISMETSNHKDSTAPSLYVLELESRIFGHFCRLLKYLFDGRKSRRRFSTGKWRIWLQKTTQLPLDPCKWMDVGCKKRSLKAQFSIHVNVHPWYLNFSTRTWMMKCVLKLWSSV